MHDLSGAIELAPRLAAAWHHRGHAYRDLGNLDGQSRTSTAPSITSRTRLLVGVVVALVRCGADHNDLRLDRLGRGPLGVDPQRREMGCDHDQ